MNVAIIGIDETSLTSKNIEITYKKIIELKKGTNTHVIAKVRWDSQYSKTPSDNQIAIAHKLIESGADTVIGYHSQLVWPIEIYKNWLRCWDGL
jgi:poly-gamma-glutamate synthesis protein (capsule biosynthesis protein)